MTKARLDKIQGLLLGELQRLLEETKEDFAQAAQEDDLEAYDLTLTWLMGLSHGKRPPHEVVAKALALRESFTPDMVEIARKIVIVRDDQVTVTSNKNIGYQLPFNPPRFLV